MSGALKLRLGRRQDDGGPGGGAVGPALCLIGIIKFAPVAANL